MYANGFPCGSRMHFVDSNNLLYYMFPWFLAERIIINNYFKFSPLYFLTRWNVVVGRVEKIFHFLKQIILPFIGLTFRKNNLVYITRIRISAIHFLQKFLQLVASMTFNFLFSNFHYFGFTGNRVNKQLYSSRPTL